MKRLAVLVLAAACSCSGPAHPTGPVAADPTARVVKYAPLGIKADAKIPTQAVILGTDRDGGSTVIKLVDGGTAVPQWFGAYVATSALGKDLTDFAFTAPAKITIDDLARSASTTIAFLAARTGAPLDAKRMVAGIVYPDGTIGGGEVADIHDAYERMTGKTLPRPVPVDEADMAVDDAVAHALDGRYEAWQQRLALRWARLLELDAAGRLPATLTQLVVVAREAATAAEKLHTQGDSAAAYDEIAAAWAYVASATLVADVLDAVRAGTLPAAGDKLVEVATMIPDERALLQVIGAMTPSSVEAHLQVVAAYDAALAGAAFATVATARVEAAKQYLASLASVPAEQLQSDAVADKLVASLAPAVLAIHRALSADVIAHDVLALEPPAGIGYQAAPSLAELGRAFRAAAATNLALLDRAADAMPVPDDATAGPVTALAAGELAWFHSAAQVATTYGLGVVRDPVTAIVIKVEHAKALGPLLTAAERTARENARAARIATGSIPIQARIAYHNARALRDGDVADQVSALEAFWLASLYSQTAVMLARN